MPKEILFLILYKDLFGDHTPHHFGFFIKSRDGYQFKVRLPPYQGRGGRKVGKKLAVGFTNNRHR